MQENYELVQRGFRILVSAMAGYIGQEMNKTYKNKWWDEVLLALWDQKDLPENGTYGNLIDSLDIANCIRLIDRKWNDVFKHLLPQECRTWSRELMGVRNIVAHIGQQDLEQPMAERALDTMALLGEKIDSETAEEIRSIYREVRARAESSSVPMGEYTGLAQPESESKRGKLTEGSLLKMVGTDMVQKTTLTRKVTYGGKTVVYPVYRVRLEYLYYNDQNDRIATWISRYEAENGTDALSGLNRESYNRIIENFIYESNPEAIRKTQKNIELVGQREPGVTLADGRIVDGNRRYTCLKIIQRESTEPLYFETVLMDMDIQADKKQIKMLELAIQHGEEKKVDYDLIDYAVGTYRDIVQTQLLTIEEYAASTNEPLVEVKKRIEITGIICEFLEYLKLPEQYHIARDYQVYSLFQEMLTPLRQLDEEGKKQLKIIAFNNALMKAIPDQRKFIRDIKGMVKNGTYAAYFENQQKLTKTIQEKLNAAEIHSKEDIEKFVAKNAPVTEELQVSMERALLRSRSQFLKNKPVENVSKSIALMMDIDSRFFEKMDVEEKENLKAKLDELKEITEGFQKLLLK